MPKRRISILLLSLLPVAWMAHPVAAEEASTGTGAWWNIPYPAPFDRSQLDSELERIRVVGNRFVDGQGETVVFRGVAIADPDKLVLQGHWNRGLFEEIAAWGANILRLPVHPVAWRGRGREAYLELLDQAVIWATELGVYLMIDWHSIGNLETGLFQHPMYDTTQQETLEFWRTIAARYRGVPTLAFYEIFNEPTTYNGTLGSVSWTRWKAFNEQVIGVIFAHDPDVIPLVAGFDWAYSLTPVHLEPIQAEGIGYVSHPYPQKVAPPWQDKWERDFGFVADTYPVFVTEFGFKAGHLPGAHTPVVGDQEYGRAITDYFARKGISWAAWCFDPDWGPQLISDWEYTPTESGAFFRQVLSQGR